MDPLWKEEPHKVIQGIRLGGSHLELEPLGRGALPLFTQEPVLGFLWATSK